MDAVKSRKLRCQGLSERLGEVLGWDPWRGGCDNIMDLREKGELKPLLQEARATDRTVSMIRLCLVEEL